MKNISLGLTFDDVLLSPKRSAVFSRKDVNVKTRLSRHIELAIPIIPANMDTVTEAPMARFMAQLGSIGFIHRFSSIEYQVEQVRRVKRAEGVMIEDPYTISPQHTIQEARELMERQGVSGLLVVNEGRVLVGILTRRDIMLEEDYAKPILMVMTKEVITAPVSTSPEEARRMLKKHRIEKLPLVDHNKIVRGLVTLKDILKNFHPGSALKDKKGRLMVGAALGVKDGYLDRAGMLIKAGADVLLIDIAHGHSERVFTVIKKLREAFGDVEIIAGNVATPEGVTDLIKAGADAVKVGIGPGAGCITRIVTGVGVPQLSAILDCAATARKLKIPIIADGGIRTSGDFSKALAAGASTVMAGSLFAGTDEAPGEYIFEDGVAYKLYRGQASRDAQQDMKNRESPPAGGSDGATGSISTPEGKAGKVSYRGSASKVVEDLIGGLRSSMSYLGAHTLEQFQKNAEFVQITQSGIRESHSHDIKI